jgi:hypothetical protein
VCDRCYGEVSFEVTFSSSLSFAAVGGGDLFELLSLLAQLAFRPGLLGILAAVLEVRKKADEG